MSAAIVAVAGCSTPRLPYTDAEAQRATTSIAGARTWADKPDPAFTERTVRALAGASRPGHPATYLALSGGGGDGAYGAGFLNGWSQAGTRPSFTIVSGVSTGALIAPFAFLGGRYDPVITDVYTSGVAETLLDSPDPFRAVFGSSLFSSDRLRELVERYVTPDVIAQIGAEHARGRQLFVVTTNLDSQRPVLWDLGALAENGSPEAAAMLRTAMVASASIPAIFPAVLIDAQADGRSFQELHVDGTVSATVFTLPRRNLATRSAPGIGRTNLYVLMNAKLQPDFNVVTASAAEIGTRTFSTFVKDQARGDLVDTYEIARRSGAGFKVTYIERDFPTQNGAGFDTAYMRRLYAYGLERGRQGSAWHTQPPDLASSELAAVSR